MKKILQINVVSNAGSTGRITEGIGIAAQNAGFNSWIAYGRFSNHSTSHLIRIGSRLSVLNHIFLTRLLDCHGLSSIKATSSFLKEIEKIQPDLIHLHNIHGYYINYKSLFNYLFKKNIPIVWTLHDCWPFTGHCSYFSYSNCTKWKSGCYSCPQKGSYPASFFVDRSRFNYADKKKSFTSIKKLTLVSVSHWLDALVSESFFKHYNHITIHNGIDTQLFTPFSNISEIRNRFSLKNDDFILLGVASKWCKRKGIHDFIKLSKYLKRNNKIVLIGLRKDQIRELPPNFIGIEHVNSIDVLAGYYSMADLFLNLTYEENYPSTNLEAISCGTPCLTYRTGGSPESLTPETGFVVPQGDLNSVLQCIEVVQNNGKYAYSQACRNYALEHFRQEDRFLEYIDLYKQILHI